MFGDAACKLALYVDIHDRWGFCNPSAGLCVPRLLVLRGREAARHQTHAALVHVLDFDGPLHGRLPAPRRLFLLVSLLLRGQGRLCRLSVVPRPSRRRVRLPRARGQLHGGARPRGGRQRGAGADPDGLPPAQAGRRGERVGAERGSQGLHRAAGGGGGGRGGGCHGSVPAHGLPGGAGGSLRPDSGRGRGLGERDALLPVRARAGASPHALRADERRALGPGGGAERARGAGAAELAGGGGEEGEGGVSQGRRGVGAQGRSGARAGAHRGGPSPCAVPGGGGGVEGLGGGGGSAASVDGDLQGRLRRVLPGEIGGGEGVEGVPRTPPPA